LLVDWSLRDLIRAKDHGVLPSCETNAMNSNRPPVLILCGGRGTRLRTGSRSLPKPLVEIGGMPVVWHVVRIYAAQGFTDFRLLTGHRAEEVEAFTSATQWPDGISVSCVFTGEDTPTGGRVQRAVSGGLSGPVCVTYADGVADLDLAGLLEFHFENGAAATVTVVQPELPFGVAQMTGDNIVGFKEKPTSTEWINGGFMVLEEGALSLIGPDDILERAPFEKLAAAGELAGYRHRGFWFCMDTYKDQVALNDLWEDGSAPWRNWT
jgi:glucose-1-phosphate cytidylyltransferase